MPQPRSPSQDSRDRRAWLVVGAALVAVALADLSGMSKAEVERIWLPFAPFVLAATRAGLAPLRSHPARSALLDRSAGGYAIVLEVAGENGMVMAERVLVVEDDPTVAEVVSRYLEREGYRRRDRSATEQVALARALEDLPRLVVLDLMLPGIDGLEVCRRLRADAPVPVIMLTARGDEEDRVVGLELGADDYLAKPFSPRELTARVKAVLRAWPRQPTAVSIDDSSTSTTSTIDVACARGHVSTRPPQPHGSRVRPPRVPRALAARCASGARSSSSRSGASPTVTPRP